MKTQFLTFLSIPEAALKDGIYNDASQFVPNPTDAFISTLCLPCWLKRQQDVNLAHGGCPPLPAMPGRVSCMQA